MLQSYFFVQINCMMFTVVVYIQNVRAAKTGQASGSRALWSQTNNSFGPRNVSLDLGLKSLSFSQSLRIWHWSRKWFCDSLITNRSSFNKCLLDARHIFICRLSICTDWSKSGDFCLYKNSYESLFSQMSAESKIAALGITLPDAPKPGGVSISSVYLNLYFCHPSRIHHFFHFSRRCMPRL